MTNTTNSAVHHDWASAPERSNLILMRVMVWISLNLGRPIARAVLHPIVAYFLLASPASRRASRAYLQRALAQQGRTPGWGDVYRHFFNFAATVHDRVYLANKRVDLFELQGHGLEHFDSLIAQGQGVFLMGAHLGSFDVLRAAGQRLSAAKVAMVMHEGNARKLHAALSAINPNATQNIIALGQVDSMLRVAEYLAQGYAIGMLADRTPGGGMQQSVPFLGAPARFPTGPFRMAAMLQRPVLFMAGLYLGGNRYAIHLEPIADFSAVTREQRSAAIEAAVERYAALLEKYCRAAPYNWFNFFDFWQGAPAAAQA